MDYLGAHISIRESWGLISEEQLQESYDFLIAYYKNMPDEEKKYFKFFNNGFKESDYLQMKDKFEMFGKTIPSYEFLCEECNVEPEYDTKTGIEWEHECRHRIKILNISGGWKDSEEYQNKKISWVEFTERRRKCECDYTKFTEDIKKRNNLSNRTIAGEAKAGQFIKILSGSQNGKTGKVINYLGDHTMMTVEVDGINKAICKTNLVDIIE